MSFGRSRVGKSVPTLEIVLQKIQDRSGHPIVALKDDIDDDKT